MKCGYTPKWVHPKKMITHFSEVFKDVDVKKTSLRNLLFVILAVAVAKTFRINAIAARLPIVVKKEKSKQKRLLRFLETPLPLQCPHGGVVSFRLSLGLETKDTRLLLCAR